MEKIKNKTKVFDKLQYTTLTTVENQLTGGFSVAFSNQRNDLIDAESNPNICQTVNNCHGGNCHSTCGK